MECCKEYVVKLPENLALVLLIINIIFPGVGTMVSGCAGDKVECNVILIGLLQLVTAPLIVGWVWSIFHGVWLWQKAKGEKLFLIG